MKSAAEPVAAIEPLTGERWADLEGLFGPGGACFGCWCQFWRMPRPDWRQAKAADNKAALRKQARVGPPPGLIGYDAAGTPIGWVAVGLRSEFPGLRNSRFFGDTPDDQGLWSIVCFFVPPTVRGRGIAEVMLAGAVRYARGAGARIVEAYPWDLGIKPAASSSLYVGTFDMFTAAGFKEVARRVPHRPVVRRVFRSRR